MSISVFDVGLFILGWGIGNFLFLPFTRYDKRADRVVGGIISIVVGVICILIGG